jgi:quercetin dioxygenase-like cupin family protein
LQVPETTQDAHHLSLLVKTQDVEIVQLQIPAGSSIPTYEAAGEIILHCLKGRICLTALETSREMKGGELLYLTLNEAFDIQGIEDATVLATIIASKEGPNVQLIGSARPR